MKPFVNEGSIVREIWRKTDTVLFIFGGAAAEFALNKAVDWLYFTGKLPKDPIGRLFSTVSYAQKIIFEDDEKVKTVLQSIRTIHQNVETARGYAIPDWAYRDVLFMLIYYSVVAYEILERPLTDEEKQEIFAVFERVGQELGLVNLPINYKNWLVARNEHLDNDLANSDFTKDLYQQYQNQLGTVRFGILVEVQKVLVPTQVYNLLQFSKIKWFKAVVLGYKRLKNNRLVTTLKFELLPEKYRKQLIELEK
jgi:ER-bound oxygenase mpaB/B'/Rubber oxygenase, catalytic domain